MLKVLDIQNLIELVRDASDAALFCQAIAATLRYPPIDGQRVVLARMATIAAEHTARLHSQLSTSLDAQRQKVVGLTNNPDADDAHSASVGHDEVPRRLFVEMVHPSIYGNSDQHSRRIIRRSLHALDIVCDEIIAHPHKPITLTMMEQMTGMSSRSLRNAFYERFNCSPQEWQRNHKLDLAHDALNSGDRTTSIKDIARKYGFLSAHSFAKFYKLRFSKRPSSMREKRR